ncbi:MAG: hypothetical protein JNL67_15555 [Planctomycetaceae bacterium]|nr:hypothetical protein [Planctomycetaceae bacterium]
MAIRSSLENFQGARTLFVWGLALAWVSLCPSLSGCSLYRFGNCTLHAPNIRSVHVQMFENDTFRRGLGPWITEAVTKEIQLRTPYQIADASSADSFLRAAWLADRKTIVVETATDEGRDVGYTGQLEVTWTDRNGNPLMPSRVVKITEDVSFVPEVGQSVSTAQQDLIRKLAQQIVHQMEACW